MYVNLLSLFLYKDPIRIDETRQKLDNTYEFLVCCSVFFLTGCVELTNNPEDQFTNGWVMVAFIIFVIMFALMSFIYLKFPIFHMLFARFMAVWNKYGIFSALFTRFGYRKIKDVVEKVVEIEKDSEYSLSDEENKKSIPKSISKSSIIPERTDPTLTIKEV
jgi:hypothetical protein